ncbi:hypothetical protein E4U30_006595, partial [Claviceps sp. LM220 group G6]
LCASPPTSGVVAQWGSKEAWEGRRSLGQCLRCGVDDHQIRDSEMLSALRPAAAAGVRVLEAKVDDAVVSESEKSSTEHLVSTEFAEVQENMEVRPFLLPVLCNDSMFCTAQVDNAERTNGCDSYAAVAGDS